MQPNSKALMTALAIAAVAALATMIIVQRVKPLARLVYGNGDSAGAA